MKNIQLKWTELGNIITVNKKIFYRLLRWLQKENEIKVKILSHTGEKPKI
jgi:hypothetical protein